MTESDLLVIGCGPAGMAAATEAAGQGALVAVLDEQQLPGGQIYRNVQKTDADRLAILGKDYAAGQSLADAMQYSGIQHIPGAVVWDVAQDGTVSFSRNGKASRVRGARLILATGAMERPVPIQGWTLPGVSTAGAAQILLKSNGMVAEDAVIVGTGPLIYLLAVQMIAAGCPPKAIVETTSPGSLVSGVPHLPGAFRNVRALLKGRAMLATIKRAGVSRLTGAKDLVITGEKRAEALHFRRRGRQEKLFCSTVLLHHGVVPNTQISQLLRLDHHWNDAQHCFHPALNQWGETSLSGVFVAGDSGGIAGAVVAEMAGRIAALEALHQIGKISPDKRDLTARPYRRVLSRERALRPFLDAVYAPSASLSPPDDVVVCRCEEVTAKEIRHLAQQGCHGPNQLKAFSRAGMGPCQGRMCGLSVTSIMAEETGLGPDEIGRFRIRMPLKPVSLGELADMVDSNENSNIQDEIS